MLPIGPFSNQWSMVGFFIVPDAKESGVCVVVPNGRQRDEGVKHPSLRDAKRWMEDNGFELVRS